MSRRWSLPPKSTGSSGQQALRLGHHREGGPAHTPGTPRLERPAQGRRRAAGRREAKSPPDREKTPHRRDELGQVGLGQGAISPPKAAWRAKRRRPRPAPAGPPRGFRRRRRRRRGQEGGQAPPALEDAPGLREALRARGLAQALEGQPQASLGQPAGHLPLVGQVEVEDPHLARHPPPPEPGLEQGHAQGRGQGEGHGGEDQGHAAGRRQLGQGNDLSPGVGGRGWPPEYTAFRGRVRNAAWGPGLTSGAGRILGGAGTLPPPGGEPAVPGWRPGAGRNPGERERVSRHGLPEHPTARPGYAA